MYITEKMSTTICSSLCSYKIIPKEEYAFYHYSFDFVLDIIVFNFSLLLIGFFISMPFPALLYILTMNIPKMFAGGAHAGSRIQCSIISYVVFLFSMLSAKYFADIISKPIICVLFVLCSFAVIMLAPVDTPAKRIPVAKRKSYQKRCLICFVFLFALFCFLAIKNRTNDFFLMTICVIIILANQWIGLLSNRILERTHKC